MKRHRTGNDEPAFRLQDLVLVRSHDDGYVIHRLVSCTGSGCQVLDPDPSAPKTETKTWNEVYPLPQDSTDNLQGEDPVLILWRENDGRFATAYYKGSYRRRAENSNVVVFREDTKEYTIPDAVAIEGFGTVPGVTILKPPFGSDMKTVLSTVETIEENRFKKAKTEDKDVSPEQIRVKRLKTDFTNTSRTDYKLKVKSVDDNTIVLTKISLKTSMQSTETKPRQAMADDVKIVSDEPPALEVVETQANEPHAELQNPKHPMQAAVTNDMKHPGFVPDAPDLSSIQPFKPSLASTDRMQRNDGKEEKDTLHEQSRKSSWKVELPSIDNLAINDDAKQLLGPLTTDDKDLAEQQEAQTGEAGKGFLSAMGAWHYWDRNKRLPSKKELVVAAYVLS